MLNVRVIRIGVAAALAGLGSVLILIAATLAFDEGLPFGIAFEAAALIALLFAVTELWSELHHLRWQPITARIIAADPVPERTVGATPEGAVPRRQTQTIRVEYRVNGATYRKELSELVEPGTPVSAGRYPIDGELIIFYDPQAPYRSRLERPPGYLGFGYLSFGLFLLAGAVATLL